MGSLQLAAVLVGRVNDGQCLAAASLTFSLNTACLTNNSNMGFSEGLSIALNRMKTDCRDLFFRQSKSDNRVHPSRNHQYEKSKTKPKPISKKHSSDHPLFKSSYPRDSLASHPQLKLATSNPRKTSDPRDLYKAPLQQKLQAKR